MTLSDLRRLLTKFNGSRPASEGEIGKFEEGSAIQLPNDYKDILRRANGGEGFIGGAYLILWPIEKLRELNDAYQVAEYAPGYLLFGSDGGGEAFAFDLQSANKAIVSLPFVGMDRKEARPMGATFVQFLEELSRS